MKPLLYISLATLISLPTAASANEDAPRFGEAVKRNISIHAIPATPEEKLDTFIPADPTRKALAIERYKEDKVEEPVQAQTTDAGR